MQITNSTNNNQYTNKIQTPTTKPTTIKQLNKQHFNIFKNHSNPKQTNHQNNAKNKANQPSKHHKRSNKEGTQKQHSKPPHPNTKSIPHLNNPNQAKQQANKS